MKLSELIEELKYYKESYGDLDVQIDFDDREEIVRQGLFFVNYHQTKEKDTIQIQNYPY